MSDVPQELPSIETSRVILLEPSAVVPEYDFMLLPLFDDNTFGTATSLPFPEFTKVVGCANGLVCLSYLGDETKFALWNPYLQKLKKISLESVEPSRLEKKGVWPSPIYGFGYDSTQDDYKFVQIVLLYVTGDEEGSKIKDPTDHGKQSTIKDDPTKRTEGSMIKDPTDHGKQSANNDSPPEGKEGPMIKRVMSDCKMPVFESSEVNVYSVKSNSWKKIESMPCKGYGITSQPICLNNAICCIVHGVDSQCNILCLDLGSEEYRMFPIPDGIPDGVSRHSCLGLVGGCLCVSSYLVWQRDVWIMKQFGVAESWTLLSSHPNPEPLKLDYVNPTRPLVFSNDGRMVLLNKKGQLFWFDLEKKSGEVAEIPGKPDCRFGIRATLCEGVGACCLHDGDPVTVLSDGDSSSSGSSSSECLYPHDGYPVSYETVGGSSSECSNSSDGE